MEKTAVIYARVSSVGQADDELPLEGQIEAGRREAGQLTARVLKEFVDAGISGRTDERPAFRDAIAFCKTNKVDYFITWSTSRFARNRIDAPHYKIRLKKCGTSMVYVSNKIDSSTKEGWMMEGMLELWDEYQSRQIADDTSRSMLKNAVDGFFNGGQVQFGYRAVPEGKRKRLAIVEHEAVIVREIFELALAGKGTKAIAMLLNQRGQLRRGAPWSKQTIANTLRSWRYAGYVVFNRTSHQDKCKKPEADWIKTRAHEPVIDEVKFMKVQNLLDKRTVTRDGGHPLSNHLFTGILRCGDCGRAMMIEKATGRSKTYAYYNCGSNIKGTGCGVRRIPADEFDVWLADYIVTSIMSVENLRKIARDLQREAADWSLQREQKRAAMVSSLREVEARRRRLYDLLETSDRHALNLGDIKPRLMQLNEQTLSIERALSELEFMEPPEVVVTEASLREMQDFVREVVLTSNNPQKIREFLGGFVQRVDIRGDTAKISYRKDRLVTANATETVHSGKMWLPELVELRTISTVIRLPERFRKAA